MISTSLPPGLRVKLREPFAGKVRQLFLALSVGSLLLTTASAQLNMVFSNASSYSATNIWISLQRQNASATNTGTNVPSVSYGANPFVWNMYQTIVTNTIITNNMTNVSYTTNYSGAMSEAVTLHDITNSGGITWSSNSPGVAVYVSYGSKLGGTNASANAAAPAPGATNDPSYHIPYQNFEISYTPNPGDQGDITAINWFSAPIAIKSYNGGVNGTLQQAVGFHTGTDTILSQLKAVSGHSPAAVLTNSSGHLTRVLGPTAYPAGEFGPYASYTNYLAAMNAQNNQTVLSNSSAFNTSADTSGNSAYTNANFVFLMTNSVTSATNGYGLEASGAIIVQILTYPGGNGAPVASTNTYNDVTFTVLPTPFAGSTNDATSYFIYAGALNLPGNLVFGGTGYTNFVNYANSGGFIGNVVTTLTDQIAGELSTAFASGFVGSTNTVAQYGTNALGELPSGDWWNLTNVIGFSDVQTNSSFFNQWANVIYQNSSNSVYGMVYSDRFKNASSLVNSVSNSLNGTNYAVDTWEVILGEPVHSFAIPEPAYAVSITLAIIGFAMIKSLRRRSAS